MATGKGRACREGGLAMVRQLLIAATVSERLATGAADHDAATGS
jgi:hypothetical protein